MENVKLFLSQKSQFYLVEKIKKKNRKRTRALLFQSSEDGKQDFFMWPKLQYRVFWLPLLIYVLTLNPLIFNLISYHQKGLFIGPLYYCDFQTRSLYQCFITSAYFWLISTSFIVGLYQGNSKEVVEDLCLNFDQRLFSFLTMDFLRLCV